MDILAISGSLRSGSYNTRLVEAAAQLAPRGVIVERYDRLGELPMYNEDVDGPRPPKAVAQLRSRIADADALLISTPEYNYGVPGVLKNALDWASRPVTASPLAGKPVAIMGASPTNFGSVRAQLALRQTLLWTDSRVIRKPEVIVFRAHERFADDGRLTDEGTAALVRELLDRLADAALQPHRAA
jgi:chromate reductase